jgi:uncharacterized membrane protein YphA (DoxX/SURF4 family)
MPYPHSPTRAPGRTRHRLLSAARTCAPSRTTAQHVGGLYRPYSITVVRISIGVVFCWFGVLKLFPAASPAEEIAAAAMTKLTGGLLPAQVSLPLLGGAETLIGLALVTGLLLRPALALFFAHMTGVLASLALLPETMWHDGMPTLEGQYVLKNIVLVTACLAVTADELTR